LEPKLYVTVSMWVLNQVKTEFLPLKKDERNR